MRENKTIFIFILILFILIGILYGYGFNLLRKVNSVEITQVDSRFE